MCLQYVDSLEIGHAFNGHGEQQQISLGFAKVDVCKYCQQTALYTIMGIAFSILKVLVAFQSRKYIYIYYIPNYIIPIPAGL